MPTLDFSSYDPKNLSSGKSCQIPGKCLMLVDSVVFKEGKKGPYYRVNMIIEAHENETAVGQAFTQFFSMDEEKSKGTLKIAKALGIVTDEMIQEAVLTGSGGIDIDLGKAYDKRFFTEISKSEYQDKNYYKLWDFYALDDPDVADYPRPADSETKDDSVEVVDDPDAADDDDDDSEIPF